MDNSCFNNPIHFAEIRIKSLKKFETKSCVFHMLRQYLDNWTWLDKLNKRNDKRNQMMLTA